MGTTDKTSAELTPHRREVPPHHGQSPEPLALEPEASSCMVRGHDLGVAQSCWGQTGNPQGHSPCW